MEKLILVILFIVVICLLIYGIIDGFIKDPRSYDQKCKDFYGKEYQFVSGNRSPDICVTVDGKVRYYRLIK